ncbi:MAG: hypothetical protein ACSHX6_10585 [Akkermansiaceae bacterium]
MKQILTIFSITMLVLLQAQNACAQLAVASKMTKKQYVAFEDVKLAVTMTNRAGQPIEFSNKLGRKWIEFVVERGTGQPVFAKQDAVFAPMLLNTGETRTSSFRLNDSYDLSQSGNYTAYAVVRMPGQDVDEGTRSSKVHFTIIKGHASWKQRAGVPGAPGDTREYRIMNVTSNEFTELFVQVEDVKRGKMLATYSMGRNLAFRDYQATLDNKNRLNVLFLTTPTIYSHTVVDASGRTVRRQYHKKGSGGTTPKLITTDSGIVGVMASTPYDPKKEQDLRSKIHNLSELPIGM